MLLLQQPDGTHKSAPRYEKCTSMPKPRDLALLTYKPPFITTSIPSLLPAFDEGIYLTCVPYSVFEGKYDMLFAEGKPWATSKRSADDDSTIPTKGSGGHHGEYFTLVDGNLKRQGSSKGAVGVKRRTTHFSGRIIKTAFSMDSAPYVVVVVQLLDGWRKCLTDSTTAVPRNYLPRPVAETIRDKAKGRILDADKLRGQVEEDTGFLPTREQIYNAVRSVSRVKDTRGRKPFTEWPKMFLQLKRGGFVRYLDTSSNPLCCMYTDSMAQRFMREILVKENLLQKRRNMSEQLFRDYAVDPTTANLNRLHRQLSAKGSTLQYPSLVIDSTFKVASMYLTVFCFKTSNFLRNGRHIYLPIALFAHATRDTSAYKTIFDHFHNYILKEYGATAQYVIPSVVTDGDPALKAAIRLSSLFRCSQHLLCTIHLSECLDRYLKKERVHESLISAAQVAIFGNARSGNTPSEARTVTSSSIDVPLSKRVEYIDGLNICTEAKTWAAKNLGNLEDVSLQSRINGLCGVKMVTSNGVEGLNKQVRVWTMGSKDLPECAQLLEDRMLRIDSDLAYAAIGKGTEIECPRAAGMDAHRASKVLGTVSTCLDSYNRLPFFGEIEALFGYKYVTEIRKKATLLKVYMWTEAVYSVYDQEKQSGYSVNLDQKVTCSCRNMKALCEHILCVWGAMENEKVARCVEVFISKNAGYAQRQQLEDLGGGNKTGKKRRRGSERTRRPHNTDVEKFVHNPYAVESDCEEDVYSSEDSNSGENAENPAGETDFIGQLSQAIDNSFTLGH